LLLFLTLVIAGDAEQLRHLTLLVWSLLVELASRLKRPVSEDGVQQLLALADGNEQTLQLVATYYASQNRSQDTIAVLKLLPESEDVLTQMGMLHMSANENEAAQEVLTRALRLLEKEHGVQSLYLAKTLWLLGLALQGAKRPHDAQRHLLRLMALVKKENNAEFEARVSRQLAIVSAQQGLPNQHLYYLKYALRLAEPFPELKSALEQELAITLKKH
jgi:tetratricopeptide (TPR) repeat protein